MMLNRLVLAGIVTAFLPMLASAADPSPDPSTGVVSSQQIEQALQPPKRTRGLTRTDTNEAPPAPPSMNLNIPFEHNSSAIGPKAEAQLKELRTALVSPSYVKDRFEVAGHTDAQGNPAYNKQLSAKRAEAVKHYLVANGVDAGRLTATGFGSEHLLAPDRPDDPSNRRVEIRNLGSATQ
jgi:OOP family OmpA-OmpF porin